MTPDQPAPRCAEGQARCPLIEEVDALRRRCRELEAMVRTDALTGFYNYRYLIDALEREMERTRRTGLATGLIMLDLDHFKRINDRYGHEKGNEALVHVAGLIRRTIRRLDLPCRYGGEEFLVILPATRLEPALLTAGRIQRILHQTPVKTGENRIELTASFGVDAFSPREGLSAGELIHRVDRFVLEAKGAGRDQIRYDKARVRNEATEVTDAERKGLLRRSS